MIDLFCCPFLTLYSLKASSSSVGFGGKKPWYPIMVLNEDGELRVPFAYQDHQNSIASGAILGESIHILQVYCYHWPGQHWPWCDMDVTFKVVGEGEEQVSLRRPFPISNKVLDYRGDYLPYLCNPRWSLFWSRRCSFLGRVQHPPTKYAGTRLIFISGGKSTYLLRSMWLALTVL